LVCPVIITISIVEKVSDDLHATISIKNFEIVDIIGFSPELLFVVVEISFIVVIGYPASPTLWIL